MRPGDCCHGDVCDITEKYLTVPHLRGNRLKAGASQNCCFFTKMCILFSILF
uniref:Uncharacterized protein n=1 Tax=Anguilla anguilla TaxID=7936 RepID=A0A0E9VFN4_ANGAN